MTTVQSFLWPRPDEVATSGSMQTAIRPATIADSDAIADILADGWARAYSGFMPPHVLAPRADRTRRRAELLEFIGTEFDPTNEALFVAGVDEIVCGFIHVVVGDKADLGTGGYVSLLYVRQEASGQGIGRRLLREGASWLQNQTEGPIAIAAFEGNPFHGFYAHLGGTVARINPVRIDDFDCRSLIYLWPSAKALGQHANPPAA